MRPAVSHGGPPKQQTMQCSAQLRPSLGLRPVAARPQAALHAAPRLQSAAQPPRQLGTAQVGGGWQRGLGVVCLTFAVLHAQPLSVRN